MKKVLYIGGFCMPDGNAAAQRVLGVAKAMRENGYNVRFSGLSRNIAKGKEEGEVDGFSYTNYPYPNSINGWRKYLCGHDSSIPEIENYKPNIVVLYNHPAFAIEQITKYCHNKGIKVLGDVTEWYEPKGNPIFKIIKGYDTNRRMTKSHLMVDGLICISSFLSEYYKNKGINVVEIPPLIDITQSKWHQDIRFSPDAVRIVYAGSPGKNKDRLDLILKGIDRIVAIVPNKIIFDIIGLTELQYRNIWNDTTTRNYVTFNGKLPHEEVIKKLLTADFQIFLRPDTLPNRAGFPTKFVETVTSRTIPITNLSSNLRDFLKNNENGFVIESLESDAIYNTLFTALSLKRIQIDSMKNKLSDRLFDFHNYITAVQTIL